MEEQGGQVVTPVPSGGLRDAGQAQVEATRNARASRLGGQSPMRYAEARGVGMVMGAKELNAEQVGAFRQAYEAERSATGNRPPQNRSSYGSFDSARTQLNPRLQQTGVAMAPLPCTCPPCGPTAQPSPTPG